MHAATLDCNGLVDSFFGFDARYLPKCAGIPSIETILQARKVFYRNQVALRHFEFLDIRNFDLGKCKMLEARVNSVLFSEA